MISHRISSILIFVLLIIVVTAFTLSLRVWSSTSSPIQPLVIPEDADPWTWETVSRFGANPPTNDDNDDVCSTFPTYLLSHIQVVLKIGASEPPGRVDTQLATVTRCISNLIIVSDRESEIHGHHVHDVLASYPPSFWRRVADFKAYETVRQGDAVDGSMGWNLDRFKFLPMVERACDINPAADWFVFLESDTYIFWDNLFRLLDQYDPRTALYFGSPSPGRTTREESRTYFAYGGAGFVLSAGAVGKLLRREVGLYGQYEQPSVALQFTDMVQSDCCGDSVLGWALYQKGVPLSGLWPMFNPHSLHGIPFDDVHWCQPVISLHKTHMEDMKALQRLENQRNRTEPLLYADLMDFLKLGTFAEKADWDNGDWGGFQDPPTSPAHSSLEACRTACRKHAQCFSYTYDSGGRCIFVRTMRLGSQKVGQKSQMFAGWDVDKIKGWRAKHQCKRALWVKPSHSRIF